MATDVERIKQALTGISDYPIVYWNYEIYINWDKFVMSTSPCETRFTTDYVRVDEESRGKALDMSIGISGIHYKCGCHDKCLDDDHCELKCKMSHDCNFELPKLENFRKFKIYHGHGVEFKIRSQEEYEKYQEVPCRFRRFIYEEFDGPDIEYQVNEYMIEKYHDLPVKSYSKPPHVVINFESFCSKFKALVEDIKFFKSVGCPVKFLRIKTTDNPNLIVHQHKECLRTSAALPGVKMETYQSIP